MNQQKKKVNEILKYIRKKDITETSNLIKAGIFVATENLGGDVKKYNWNDKRKDLSLKRTQAKLDMLCNDISVLNRKRKGCLKSKKNTGY